jgi:ribosomal protein S18 acetylase RimI-like enzyme
VHDCSMRAYDPERDEMPLYHLWQRTLGELWPLTRAVLHAVTVGHPAYRAGDHLVAEAGEQVIGFVGTQTWRVPDEAAPRGELVAIVVDPAHRRQGTGRALLEHGLRILDGRGVGQVQVGGGGCCYFWPGVPANLPGAWAFFAACGWQEAERSYDLVADLAGYATPPYVYQRIRRPGVEIATASAEDIPAVLRFEAQHMAEWLHFYRHVAEGGGHADIVLARHPDLGVVGTSCVLDPRAPWSEGEFTWERLLGRDCGGVGPLGVMEAVREKGIGLALAARVTELLQQRGLGMSYVGWTWLVDWYGRLGYRVWREYVMSWK